MLIWLLGGLGACPQENCVRRCMRWILVQSEGEIVITHIVHCNSGGGGRGESSWRGKSQCAPPPPVCNPVARPHPPLGEGLAHLAQFPYASGMVCVLNQSIYGLNPLTAGACM